MGRSKVITLMCGLVGLCLVPAPGLADDDKDAESLRMLRLPDDVPLAGTGK